MGQNGAGAAIIGYGWVLPHSGDEDFEDDEYQVLSVLDKDLEIDYLGDDIFNIPIIVFKDTYFWSWGYTGDEIPLEIFENKPSIIEVQQVKDFFKKYFGVDIGEPSWRIGWSFR